MGNFQIKKQCSLNLPSSPVLPPLKLKQSMLSPNRTTGPSSLLDQKAMVTTDIRLMLATLIKLLLRMESQLSKSSALWKTMLLTADQTPSQARSSTSQLRLVLPELMSTLDATLTTRANKPPLRPS